MNYLFNYRIFPNLNYAIVSKQFLITCCNWIKSDTFASKSIKSMSTDTDKYFEASLKYTKIAGELIRERISSRNKTVEIKSCEIDLVTETDQQVEKLLIENLSNDFPGHKFIGEESSTIGKRCELTDDPTWIIDPVDGTMNFVHSFPHSCISLGLFVNQQPEIGIVYNPILNQLFTAKRGGGAHLNGTKLNVSGEKELSKALITMEFGTSRDPEKMEITIANQRCLLEKAHGLRALGSAALDIAMVAMGAADAYFEFGIHVWDVAAAALLVTEAGGVVTDPAGGPIDWFSRRFLVASTPALAEELSKNLVQFYPTPRD